MHHSKILLRGKKNNHIYKYEGGIKFTNLTTGKSGEMRNAKNHLIISQRLTELPEMAKKLIELCKLELIN
jgi:hypothetical protein